MNQTWENGKKPNFGQVFGLFDPNLGPKNIFAGFTFISQGLFQTKTESDFRTLPWMTYFFQRFVLSKQL